MKILMLHGSRQSGELFRAKIQGLEKLVKQALGPVASKDTEFIYPTAPLAREVEDGASDLRDRHGSWTWLQPETIDDFYPKINETLAYIATIMKESGPFDGVIGFSQGGALAAMVASLLEENRKEGFARAEDNALLYPNSFAALDHPPLRFFVSIAGYAASNPAYRAFYEPPIQIPSLHLLGSMDTVVDETASTKLTEICENSTVVWHPGGHTIPSGKRQLIPIAYFISSTLKA
ncbi:Serine hydrolase FSH [Penicillium angulare]|uniref:Serine hydrolase FSH n=1 Tax=Penicillium angulare TaxID=116970 RepID=UPI002541DEFC|nr:Serine hydrolase FSH [Penicillium angulare]KAJ5287096.1 Serine hydrolase FSH [Penicillium angulare]